MAFAPPPPPPKPPKPDPVIQVQEDAPKVFEIVRRLEGAKGARWGQVIDEAQAIGILPERTETALEALMDEGKLWKQTLGTLRVA